MNIRDGSDLTPLLGELSPDRYRDLVDRLIRVDARLAKLAEVASLHVQVPYSATPLSHVTGEGGRSAGFHGGSSGDAGDIWVDVSPDERDANGVVVRWVVESLIVVFCADAPEPRGGSATHPLVKFVETVHSPQDLVAALETQVAALEAEVLKHPPGEYTKSLHADLPKWG